MSYPYRTDSFGESRCSIRLLAGGYGFCQGGARSCAECPRAKLDKHSPTRIEEGDTVRTATGELCTVERFEERNGLLTGYVWLSSQRGSARYKISGVVLHRKKAGYKSAA